MRSTKVAGSTDGRSGAMPIGSRRCDRPAAARCTSRRGPPRSWRGCRGAGGPWTLGRSSPRRRSRGPSCFPTRASASAAGWHRRSRPRDRAGPAGGTRNPSPRSPRRPRTTGRRRRPSGAGTRSGLRRRRGSARGARGPRRIAPPEDVVLVRLDVPRGPRRANECRPTAWRGMARRGRAGRPTAAAIGELEPRVLLAEDEGAPSGVRLRVSDIGVVVVCSMAGPGGVCGSATPTATTRTSARYGPSVVSTTKRSSGPSSRRVAVQQQS